MGTHEHRLPEGDGRGPVSRGAPVALERFREFWLTSLALRHRTSTLVLFILVTIAGLAAYVSIPKEAAPEIEVPYIAVSAIYPGVSAGDMESLITRVIEEKLNTIADIKELTSTSVEGYSSIVAEFEPTVDLEEALQKVREKVDLAKPDLPDDVEEPIISEFNFAEFPIMQVNISGEYGLVRLKDLAEDLQDRLEQIPSILEVRLSGGLEREVKVEVDLPRMKYYGIALDDVIDAIHDENVNVPGGSIDVGTLKYLVRVDGEFTDPRTIEDVVVTTKEGRPIYVRDVASVSFGFKERESYARLDGNPVVTLDIVKRVGENIIETAEAVKGVVAEMQPQFPPTTVVKITSDQSKDIENMVSSLENNIISGLLLILAVLLFFLGLRNAGFVAVAIPTSMFLSFMVLKAAGITMNMVVLFSLILALGMLVDNAIVVTEVIYRFVEQGFDRGVAARKATGEVAIPVISSTLTTLAAFFPLLFWPGIVGEFMKFLPWTLIITLSSSLFVALVIVPVLCALFMRLDGSPAPKLTREARWVLLSAVALAFLAVAAANALTAVLLLVTGLALVVLHNKVLARAARWFQDRGVPVIIGRYERTVRWALDHRAFTLAATAAAFVVSVVAFRRFNLGVEFFPEDIPPSQAWIDIEAPVGTNADFTNSVALRLEDQLQGMAGMEDAESVVATVGGSGGDFVFGGGSGGTNAGRVTISFKDYVDRRTDVFETIQGLQAQLGRDIAGADITAEVPEMGPPSGKPVNLEIVGEDPQALKVLAERAIAILEGSPVYQRLEGLESDMERGRPELSVQVDREKAALYGLSTAEVGRAIRGAIQGIEAAKYRTGTDEYDIVVRLSEPYRSALSALNDLTVMADEGRQIPLLSVAHWSVGEGFGSIQRKDLDRVVTVSADVRAGENSNAVLAEVQGTLDGFAGELPTGYSLRYTGQQQEQQESQDFLLQAFVGALMLIAFILIAQFDSVVKPLIIMTSVIMSTIGVLIGLMVFRMPFGIIMTGVGVISLAGVVVNNAIILIDYIDTLRERDGMNRREALVKGGMTRFRPVILTATTTALGLVPLAMGLNINFLGLYRALEPDLYWGGEQAAWWGPMAIAVIVGILFATFLTLVLVPVMYSLVDDFVAFAERHFRRVTVGTADTGGAPVEGEGGGVASPGRHGEEAVVPVRASVG